MKETDSETAKNQAVLQSLSTTYSWLCKVNTDTKRRERKVRDKGKAYPEKKFQKEKKNLCGQLDATAERKAGHTQTGMHAGMLLLVPSGPGGIA